MLNKLFSCMKGKSSKLPAYVERDDDMSFPAPIVVENAVLNCFFVKVDQSSVKTLLDKTFSDPSGGAVKYVPVSNYAFVVLGDMSTLYSSAIDVGTTSEKELTIWILAAAVDSNNNDKIDRLVLFPAYVIADDPYSLVSGRESLGFFKSWGALTGVEGDGDPPNSLSVSVFGHGVKGDHAAFHEVLNFSQTTGPAKDFTLITSIEEATEYILSFIRESEEFFHGDFTPDWALFESLFKDMWNSEFPIALLKQIRDSSTDGAVYQAILESNSKINRFEKIEYLGKYQCVQHSIFSFRPDESLGIATADESYHGFRVVMDFQIDGGKEIWKA